MHAVRQSMRPKHQVLILKCYPRYQKGVSEVKPNSSELSYLLYYASTRRSKIQKVGSYLEQKTELDVPRGRLGNVQVTLQILRALMDKSPRDISLYAPYVLRILIMVLNSKDINMVEETVPTFETLCEHQDHATLTADQELARLYDAIVRAYAGFADKPPAAGKSVTAPIAVRWKNAGLKALKSISPTDIMAIDGGRQLGTIVPVLLKSLYSDDDTFLLSLYNKATLDKETPPRRRGSISTARTSTQMERPNPVLSDTAAAADREAAEEAAMLALYSLKQIFSAHNRAQIRLATSNVLNFLTNTALIKRPGTSISVKSGPRADWPTTLIEMIATWTPVQDRFVIVVTAMERLMRYAPLEENLAKQLTISKLVQYLLGSSINMIGLSVMDILLGLVQQILVVLQVSGTGANALPMHARLNAIDLFPETKEDDTESKEAQDVPAETSTEPSATRQELLRYLQSCMANLATHIYYGDQISDIVTAVLTRLKPSTNSTVPTPTAAVEKPAAAAQVIADSAHIKEDPNTDSFFSFGTARVIALNAVKEVLVIANRHSATVGAAAVGRNKVTARVWEGTQWLLRDEDRRVRRAYVGALSTWLSLELDKKDLRIVDEKTNSRKNRPTAEDNSRATSSIARAASTASKSSRTRPIKTTFLQLLHLAIYDNVLDNPEDNDDVLLMHLLLTSVTDKLGVNALKSSLPMIIRLQEDINTTSACKTPKAKVNVGSLVHGYLLHLSRVFDFETTMPGYEIGNEISRRKKANLWLAPIQEPALPLDKLVTAGSLANGAIPEETAKSESLKPFDDIQAMVNQIGIHYSNSLMAPQSPPQSPGRGITFMSTSSVLSQRNGNDELPQDFKDTLMARWSKESCIATLERDSKTASPHGSRSGTTHSVNNGYLTAGARSTRDHSPALLDVNQDSQPLGSLAIITASKRHRSSSANGSGPPTPTSNIEARTIRMDELKRVLAGHSMADAMSERRKSSSTRGGSPLRTTSTAQHFGSLPSNVRTIHRPSIISTGSDSIVDAEGFESASEGDLDHDLPSPQSPLTAQEVQQFQNMQTSDGIARSPSRTSRARSNSSASAEDPEANARALKGDLVPPVIARIFGQGEDVPPVPPIPQGIQRVQRDTQPGGTTVSNAPSIVAQPTRDRSVGRNGTRRNVAPSLKTNTKTASDVSSLADDNRRMLVHSLLNSIEVDDQNGDLGVGRPPY